MAVVQLVRNVLKKNKSTSTQKGLVTASGKLMFYVLIEICILVEDPASKCQPSPNRNL